MEYQPGRGSAASVMFLAFMTVTVTLVVAVHAAAAAAAVVHQVGGTPGWGLPSIAGVNYTQWAATQTFRVGDTLYFNYSSTYHNVLEVNKSSYDNCVSANPNATWSNGDTRITLNKTGMLYYICGFPNHCSLGQKVAIDVVAEGSAPTPGSSPTSNATIPSSSSTPTLSPSSSKSFAPSLTPSQLTQFFLIVIYMYIIH